MFLMSIEAKAGKSFIGFYLGTDERIARQLCERCFYERLKSGLSTITIALLSADHKIIDVYHGDKWYSQIMNEIWDVEMEQLLLF